MTTDYRSENDSIFIHTKEYIKWQFFFLPTDAQLDNLKNNFKFNANLKLFLKLSNCASVGKKNFDNYQDALYVREKKCIKYFTFQFSLF